MTARWIDIAARYVGTREVAGPGTNPLIRSWLIKLGAWWQDDAAPWCGVFAGEVFKEAGIAIPAAFYRAKAWAEWGMPLLSPVVGCIVVFGREGGGHVGIVVGQTPAGLLLVLGGNQGDAVNIAAFNRNRAIAYRWPPGEPCTTTLPIVASAAALSVKES
jgi:uncharacterized protein (TIGR02594 family)